MTRNKILTSASMLFLILTSSKSISEPIRLNCKLDRGWDWNIVIDLGQRTLRWAEFPDSKIIDFNDTWIIAHYSALYSGGEDFAEGKTWVINRKTGRFWASHFGKYCSTLKCEDAAFGMQNYEGFCTRGF